MKTTIKKALNTAVVDGSIFKELPIYGEDMTAQKMAIAYTLQHSGYKIVSRFLEEYLDSQGHITSDGITQVGAILTAIFKDAWDREYAAITAEYNPIHNYDRTELTIDTKSGADTDTMNHGAGHVESTGSVKGFNSSTFTDSTKNVSDSRAQTDSTTHGYDSEVVKDSHVSGNIGTTKTQEMIQDEFYLRRMYNFYKSMMDDIDSYLALHVFGTEKETANLNFDMNISITPTENGYVITVGNQSVEIHNGEDGRNGLTPVLDLRENGDLYVDYEEV